MIPSRAFYDASVFSAPVCIGRWANTWCAFGFVVFKGLVQECLIAAPRKCPTRELSNNGRSYQSGVPEKNDFQNFPARLFDNTVPKSPLELSRQPGLSQKLLVSCAHG